MCRPAILPSLDIQRMPDGEKQHMNWISIAEEWGGFRCLVLFSNPSASRGGDRNADEAVSDGQRPSRVDHCFDRGDVDQRRRNVESLHTRVSLG